MELPRAGDCTDSGTTYMHSALSAIHVLVGDLDSEPSATIRQSRIAGHTIHFDRTDHISGIIRCSVPVMAGDTVFPAFFKIGSPDWEGAGIENTSSQAKLHVTIGGRTQVLLERCCDLFPSLDENDDEVEQALVHEVRTSLLGYANRYIRVTDDIIVTFRVGSLLLTGQSGAGCAAATRSVARRHDARLVRINCAEVYASAPEGPGRGFTRRWGRATVIKLILTAAVGVQPCVVLLDDLHFLTPSGEHCGATEASEGMAEGLVDGLRSLRWAAQQGRPAGDGGGTLRVLVVGCCYSEASVSADVTAAFEEHLHFPLPTASQRRTVLESAWQRHARVASRDRPAEGQGEGGAESTAPPPALHALADSLAGLPLVPLLVRAREAVDSLARNSSTAAVTAANAASGAFGGVAGQERAKRALTECVLWPRRYPELFRSFLAPGLCAAGGVGSGQAGAGGVLLFGPPGTGKTLLPRALAAELKCSLVAVRLSDLVRGEVGSSERRLREVFQEARATAPAVIFIDEFQALFVAREEAGGGSAGSTLSAALAGCFDDLAVWNRYAGAEAQVTVIAATNEPWAVDASFLRPGRLGRCLLVGPLDGAGRRELLDAQLGRAGLSAEEVSSLVASTRGFSGADIKLLCARAVSAAEKAGSQGPALSHFRAALAATRASASEEDMQEYREWQAQHPHLLQNDQATGTGTGGSAALSTSES